MSLVIDVQAHKVAVGAKAAKHVADTVRSVVASQGCARVIFATGASQFEFLHSLTCEQDAVPWDKVTAFHLDEVGLLFFAIRDSVFEYAVFEAYSNPVSTVH